MLPFCFHLLYFAFFFCSAFPFCTEAIMLVARLSTENETTSRHHQSTTKPHQPQVHGASNYPSSKYPSTHTSHVPSTSRVNPPTRATTQSRTDPKPATPRSQAVPKSHTKPSVPQQQQPKPSSKGALVPGKDLKKDPKGGATAEKQPTACTCCSKCPEHGNTTSCMFRVS